MVAGILLALRASGDEIALYRKGRNLWPAGVAMVVGGLLLGGLPFGLLHDATDSVGPSWTALTAAVIVSTALTGAAVLRAAAPIFAGLSGSPGPEITAPTEREREKDDRPLWLMLAPCVLMLAIALIPGHLLMPFLSEAAVRLIDPLSPAPAQTPAAPLPLTSYAPIVLTIALFALSLCRSKPTASISRQLFHLGLMPFRALQFLHSGIVGDYVVWIMLGVAALVLAIGGWTTP
jgi:multicomponent Na+:H+ antiporter subunit D